MPSLVEHKVTAPLPEGWTYTGLLDEFTSDRMICDYKITTDPLAYVTKTTLSLQVECYAIGLESAGHTITGVQYRLLARPQIRFTQKETIEEYEERCVDWLYNPATLSTRIIQDDRPFIQARLDAARAWLEERTRRARHCRRTRDWNCNFNACHDYKRECEFLPICLGMSYGQDYEKLIRDEYHVRPERHVELGDTTGDTISFSSASCMTQCEMKYYLKHERNLSSRCEEESEALATGSLFHEARALYVQRGIEVARYHVDNAVERMIRDGMAERDALERGAKTKALVTVSADRWPREE